MKDLIDYISLRLFIERGIRGGLGRGHIIQGRKTERKRGKDRGRRVRMKMKRRKSLSLLINSFSLSFLFFTFHYCLVSSFMTNVSSIEAKVRHLMSRRL